MNLLLEKFWDVCNQGFQWRKDRICEPPWDYDFLYYLPESEYPKYLRKIFQYRTEEDLPLKPIFKSKTDLVRHGLCDWVIDKNKCKTFNQKLQWIKLNGVTPLMRDCTDKVKAREYVKEKIGSEYLKPVLQVIPDITPNLSAEEAVFSDKMSFTTENDVSSYFDRIDWEKLPDKFILKCNHGCKWHCIIKDKEKFLSVKQVYDVTKNKMTGWLEQEFWVYEGFETNYKGLEHKILVEPFMKDEGRQNPEEINVYCFKGIPKLIMKQFVYDSPSYCCYDENFNVINPIFVSEDEYIKQEAEENIKTAVELSKQLSKDFNFVRVDWMIYKNKPYFSELTFTPYSGFSLLEDKWNKKLGDLIEI